MDGKRQCRGAANFCRQVPEHGDRQRWCRIYIWSASAIPLHSSVKSLWHPEDDPTKAADIPPAIGVAAGTEEYVEILAEDGAVYEWGYGPIQNQKAKSRLPMAASP